MSSEFAEFDVPEQLFAPSVSPKEDFIEQLKFELGTISKPMGPQAFLSNFRETLRGIRIEKTEEEAAKERVAETATEIFLIPREAPGAYEKLQEAQEKHREALVKLNIITGVADQKLQQQKEQTEQIEKDLKEIEKQANEIKVNVNENLVAQQEKAKRNLEENNQDLQDLRLKLQGAENENKINTDQLQMARDIRSQLEKDKKNIQDEINSLITEGAKATKEQKIELAEKQKQLQEVQNELIDAQQEITNLQTMITEQQDQIQDLQYENENLVLNAQLQEESITKLDDQIVQQKQQIKEKEAKITNLGLDLETAKTKAIKDASEILKLGIEIANEKKSTQIQKERADLLETEKKSLEENVEILTNDVASKNTTINQLTKSNNELNTKLEKASTLKKKLTNDKKKLTEDIKDLKEKLETAGKEKEELQKKIKEKEEALIEKDKTIGILNGKVTALQESLQVITNERDKLQIKVGTLKTKVSDLKKDIKEKNEKITELNAKIKELDENNAKLQAENTKQATLIIDQDVIIKKQKKNIKDLTDNVSKLNEDLALQKKDITDLTKKNTILTTQIEKLQKDAEINEEVRIENLKKIDNLTKEKDDLLLQITGLQNQVKLITVKHKGDIEKLEKKLGKEKAAKEKVVLDNEKLAIKIKELETQNEALQKRLDEAENQRKRWEEEAKEAQKRNAEILKKQKEEEDKIRKDLAQKLFHLYAELENPETTQSRQTEIRRETAKISGENYDAEIEKLIQKSVAIKKLKKDKLKSEKKLKNAVKIADQYKERGRLLHNQLSDMNSRHRANQKALITKIRVNLKPGTQEYSDANAMYTNIQDISQEADILIQTSRPVKEDVNVLVAQGVLPSQRTKNGSVVKGGLI